MTAAAAAAGAAAAVSTWRSSGAARVAGLRTTGGGQAMAVLLAMLAVATSAAAQSAGPEARPRAECLRAATSVDQNTLLSALSPCVSGPTRACCDAAACMPACLPAYCYVQQRALAKNCARAVMN
eukprot:364692-Chlamydomonas_euryale.AAC.10